MKTTIIIFSLLLLNSFVLVGQISDLITNFINPLITGIFEALLLVFLYAYKVVKDVRNVFDLSDTKITL